MHFISFRINKTKNWIKENKNLPIIGIGGSVRCIEKILRNHAFDDIDILVDYYMISYRNINSLFNIVKKLGSALVVIVVIAIIVAIFYFAISRLILEIGDLIENVPDLYSQLENGLRQIGGTLSGLFSRLPESVQDGWNTAVVNLDQMMGDLVKKASEPTMEAAGNFAKKLPSYVIYLIMALMSSYFFTVQREDVIQWLCKIAPPSVEKRMKLVMDNLRYAVGGYFKAQFKIMGIVFLILAVGFL